jgi:EmrB/QacA subfamily drug resistance transporter
VSSNTSQGNPDAVDPAIWRMAFTIVVGAMAVIFDTTIVSVALNDLTHELHASLSTVQWISTGYLLAMFVTIPVAGWAQSAIGGKRLWILALGLFLFGSLLCATAWDVTSLIVFRIVQGIGGGIMMPLMITLIMQAAGGKNIGRIMATVTLPATLGPILGPVLGGLILGVGNWRWLFLVNVPFCVIGAYLAFRNLPSDRPTGRTRLDVVGLLLISPGVAAVVYALSQVEGAGGFFGTRVLIPLIAGLALVIAFVAWALPRSASALINLSLLKHRPLASSSALGFIAGVTLYGAMLLLPLYWQQARGEDALGAGLLLIPQGIGTLLSRQIAGRNTDRLGPRVIALTGFTVVALATVPFAFVTADTSKVLLLAALLVRGMGMGAATIPLSSAAYIGLDRAEIPHASIISRVMMQLGGSVGTAVLAVVLQHFIAESHSPADVANAFGTAFWWSVGFTVAAIPLCLLLPGRPQPLPEPIRTEVEAEAEVESAGLT